MCAAETMGNPSSGCTTVQVAMSLSKRRHRQSLSLQLEQLGQLGCINSCEKKSVSALSSPKVTEEKSMASFLGSKKQGTTRRKPSSLCGTEEYLKGIELHGGTSSDRKPTSFNPFRGHRRVGSGSTVTPCKSLESQGGSLSFRKEKALESSPKEKGGPSLHLSFRKEKALESSPKEKGGSLHLSFRKEKALESSPKEKGGSLHSSFRREKLSSDSPREKGGSLSFRKSDRFAVTKLAASLFHSPTKVERSISMSRVAQKAIQSEEVVSLRHQYQMSSDDGAQTTCKGSGLHTLPQDIEESARPLISNASSLQHECAIDSSKLLKDEGDEELFSTTAIGDPSSGLLSGHSQVFINAPESVLSNLAVVAASNNEQPSCISELNPYGWTIKSDVSTLLSSSSENLCSSLESNSKSCADAKTPEEILSPGTGPSSIGSQSSRMETDSSEENGGEKIYAVDDMIPSRLLLGTEKVTEEELTEAAVLSSLMSEEYLTGPLFFSSEDSQKNLLRVSSSNLCNDETGLIKSTTGCDSDPTCLTKCVSFEPVARSDKSKAEGDRKSSKARKRRRSVSASGIGAMLLKVVRVSETGPMLTRRLPKVGPEVISGADALRAREYVLQKTAQISMGRAHELSSSPVSAPALCQCESQDHVVKSTSFKSGDCVELEQHPKIDLEGVDGPGCRVDCTCETRQRNQQTISEMVPRHPANTDSVSACTHEGMIHDTSVETVESCSHERVERVSSNLERTTPDGKSESQRKSALVNASTNTSAAANADERRDRGKSRKKSSSRGRNSYDSDSLTEGPKTARSNSGLGRAHSTLNKQGSLDANVAISRERSRSFISRLQAPSGISSVDVFHLAPSSISILANPSFSSSHQDRLWEEQAEAYSSGGRGTPGRDDEAAATTATAATSNVFLHSPSPGVAISSDDHQVPSATSGSLRRGLVDSSSTTAGTVCEEKGRHKRKGKRGRPHTPLRSLLADDVHSKGGARPSPEGGHFIQQIMSRIRGTSKSLSPKSPHNVPKRRNIWSSCICFSVK